MSDATTVLAEIDSWGMANGTCPHCGGSYYLNDGHRTGNRIRTFTGFKMPSHRVRGAKCAGSGIVVHYSPLLAAR